MYAFETERFDTALAVVEKAMIMHAVPVRTERWQGKDIQGLPAAEMREVRNMMFEVNCRSTEADNLDVLRTQCKPNLPWADDHFEERVSGHPLNPGVEWANWPWAKNADQFRQGRFNHNYMERYWPRYARCTDDGALPLSFSMHERRYPRRNNDTAAHSGIGHVYGDIQSVIELLVEQPYTRQAYIPIFFPEDTGTGDGGRKPCTLGYHFLLRDCEEHDADWYGLPELHVWYPMRSCDVAHHLRDDVYMTMRLALWILERCRQRRPEFWENVHFGSFSMHATSMHMFVNDWHQLNKRLRKEGKL